MTRNTFLGAIGVLFGLTLSTVAGAESFGGSNKIQATQRRVLGIITSLEDVSVTIAPLRGGSGAVTGRVDLSATRISLNGRSARLSDLNVSFRARGELGLDDVWANLVVESR